MAAVGVSDCAFDRAWSGQLHNRRDVQAVIVHLAALSAVNCTNAARAGSDWYVAVVARHAGTHVQQHRSKEFTSCTAYSGDVRPSRLFPQAVRETRPSRFVVLRPSARRIRADRRTMIG